MLKYCLSIVLLITSLNAYSQSEFKNLLFQEQQTSPPANLNAVSWLAGHWRGEAFGGLTEEVWSPPLGGSMMGAFKLVVNNQVSFYELETIIEENDSLIFRLKHFAANLKGWEEKDQTVDFKLVKVTDNKVFFNGLTLEKISDDEINIYVAIEQNGNITEEKFNYQRVKN